MAPEVIRHEAYSTNADVYSFGICLWQLMMREVPFAGMTPIQAAFQVAQGARPPIRESIPGPLRDIITSCWQQDSQKRPSFTYLTMTLCSLLNSTNAASQTLAIASNMLTNVDGNSNVNVDFSTPLVMGAFITSDGDHNEQNNVGLEI